jgi:hypothetical protein
MAPVKLACAEKTECNTDEGVAAPRKSEQGSGNAMALISKKTPEQKAIEAGIKEQERETREQHQAQAAAERVERERTERREKVRQAFFATPAGHARLAFDAGDELFQFSIDVMNQKAIVVAMVGANTSKKVTDPSAVLNSVSNEGWELATGSFVFVEEGQESRDKFASSGQNVATKGTTVGYYVFRRCEKLRGDTPEPWNEI